MITIFFVSNEDVGSSLIKWTTNSKFSHCGFVDKATNTVIDSRFNKKGVTEYSISELIMTYKHITFVEIEAISYTSIILARTQLGKGYDWSALLGIGFKRDWQQDDKWFCSELVGWAINKSGYNFITTPMWRVTPENILNKAIQLNGKVSVIKP